MTLLLYVILYTDVSWHGYCALFLILIFHDFATVCCFISGYSMTLLLYVVLYTGVSWHCYCALFHIQIFHDFATMCCFIYGCVLTLLRCIVLYPDFPWLCYYVLFYIRCVLTLLLCVVLYPGVSLTFLQINARENRRANQEWTIQRNWQHWVHNTQDEDKQSKKIQHRKLKSWATRTPPNIEGELRCPRKVRRVWRYQRGNRFLFHINVWCTCLWPFV